jgi:hypothetical protein
MPLALEPRRLLAPARNRALLDRIRAQASPPERRAPIAGIGVPTRDRPALLRRCLDSYMRNCREYGRDLEFAVFDDAREASRRAESVATLRALRQTFRARVSYSSILDREAYALALSCESGVPIDTVRFALVGTGSMVSTGGCRNALLLHFVGRRVIHVDDDTSCHVAFARGQRGGLALESVHVGTHEVFPTAADARAAVSFSAHDYVGLFEPLLGQHVANAVDAVASSDAIDLDRLGGQFARQLMQSACRVTTASPGVVGDSGLGSTAMYFFTGGAATRAMLLAFPGGHRRAFESHHMVRSSAQPSIAGGGICLGINLGLDQSGPLLPPFMPRLRDSDGVFGQARQICAPTTATAFLPWMIEHTPPAARRSSLEQITATAGRVQLSVFLRAFIKTFDAPSAEPPARMIALGRHLVELGSIDRADYLAACRRHCHARVDSYFTYADAIESEAGPGRPEWHADFRRYLGVARQTAQSLEGVVPRDLSLGRSADEAIDAGRQLIRAYGDLLCAWPAIVAAAQALHRRGERPAAPLA